MYFVFDVKIKGPQSLHFSNYDFKLQSQQQQKTVFTLKFRDKVW